MRVSALMGLVTLSFDLETGMRVASKVGNLLSKFGFSNYSLCTRRMDRRTDKSNAYCPLRAGHNKVTHKQPKNNTSPLQRQIGNMQYVFELDKGEYYTTQQKTRWSNLPDV